MTVPSEQPEALEILKRTAFVNELYLSSFTFLKPSVGSVDMKKFSLFLFLNS